MGIKLSVKPTVNKKNNQINVSLPRKQLPISLLKDMEKIKFLKIEVDWNDKI